MLKWLLFFVIGFFTASIQCSVDHYPNMPPADLDDYDDFRRYDDKDIMGLTYYLAKVEFEYTAINDKGEEVPTNHKDTILMVATENGKIVGSAQSWCRHVNPPLEQIILLESTSWYYPLKSDGEVDEEKRFNISQSCAPITYGCITLVHNYCSIFVDGLKADKTTKPAILSKNSQKPARGSMLIAAYDGDTFEVKVKNFSKCQKQFDPENLYIVDEEEQICTTRIAPELGDDPIALPAALLFEKKDNKVYLIGIESKAEGGLSLFTFAPYHCDKFEDTCSP